MSGPPPVPTACTRRALLRSAGAAGVALVPCVLAPALLAGCGVPVPAEGSPSTASASASASASSSSSAGSDAAPPTAVPAAEVPVGTAVVRQVLGDQVVLAQPVAGEFAAYSATCPHAGGIVAAADGLIVRCPLHGSVFDTGDGAAVRVGPAVQPLSPVPLTVQGDQLVLG